MKSSSRGRSPSPKSSSYLGREQGSSSSPPQNYYQKSRYSPSFGPQNQNNSKEKIKQEPNYNPSGRLEVDRLQKNGVRLKYDEPSDSAKPTRKWRIHVFKGEEQIGIISLGEKSCYRFGRDPLVSDILVEHESCSKQHSVIQHRQVTVDVGYGNYSTSFRPYIIDLESTHGTFLNGTRLQPSRFIELKPMDIIKFAFSTREYVILVEDLYTRGEGALENHK